MTNLTISILTKPATIAVSGTAGTVSGIAYFLGVVNPWIGSLTLLIGLTTAILGLIIKWKEYQKNNNKKKAYKHLHNHR